MNNIKEIVVVSGKGGTGKTSVVGALASLLTNRVAADCDVDAANLHMILNPVVIEEKAFIGGKKATIDLSRCTGCGTCREVCRFQAISEGYVVDHRQCEGCGACYFLCPAGVVDFSSSYAGSCYICRDKYSAPLVYAELLPGEENSGKLVAMVRNEARSLAEKSGTPLVIVDGPPGIGCPVISSMTGVHVAVVVTEPTISGVHDLERIIDLAQFFKCKTAVVVNKGDVNPDYCKRIEEYSTTKGCTFLGVIPYEPRITEAQIRATTILDVAPDSPTSEIIRVIHKKLLTILEEL
ncbi:MAG: ferredoxin [Syntrophorhabdus sp. PtaU1.Bin002]|nr:MAG: ferredoxin [Syntrophorhabdus sp. PtaB.Bin006]OPY66248.1 MAG: ferredoxin [Syntrophorhabdus sp. PtaU1.Bin002]